MSNSTNAILQDAFELIEQNQRDKAQNILAPLLETESNNPAVWWVYAHAVDDPKEGTRALDKVLQLDPTYPGASALKTKIVATTTPVPVVEEQSPDSIDEWDDMTFESDQKTTSSTGRSPVRFILTAVLVIVAVVAIFALLSALAGGEPQQPTAVAVQSTSVPTADIQIITNVSATETLVTVIGTPTEVEASETPPDITETEAPETEEPTTEPTVDSPTETATIEATTAYITTLVENLAEYNIAESDIETRQTLLGTTIEVTVCALPGAESSLALNGVMDSLVELNSDYPNEIEAVAVSLLDCNNDEASPRTIGVEREFVQSLAGGEIELKDFQREWKPLP